MRAASSGALPSSSRSSTRRRIVERALATMREQELDGELEILVVDGGSTRRQPRHRRRSRARRRPHPAARQPRAGARPTRSTSACAPRAATYVARMDAHTHYPARLHRARRRAAASAATSPAHGPAARAWATGRPAARSRSALQSPLGVGGARFRRRRPRGGRRRLGFCGVWRRDLLVELGGWDEDWPVNQDAELAAPHPSPRRPHRVPAGDGGARTRRARACAAWRASTGATGSIARRPRGAIPTRCGARMSSPPGLVAVVASAAVPAADHPAARGAAGAVRRRWCWPRACGRRGARGRRGSPSGAPPRWRRCTCRGGRGSSRAAGASACPGARWRGSSRRAAAPPRPGSSCASATSSHASPRCLRPSCCASSPRSTRGRGCAASSSPSFPERRRPGAPGGRGVGRAAVVRDAAGRGAGRGLLGRTPPVAAGRGVIALVAQDYRRAARACSARALVTVACAPEHARRLRVEPVDHLHAHFATYPALAAWICSRLVGVPYSFTAHAHDIFIHRLGLRRRIEDAAFCVGISEHNAGILRAVAPGRSAEDPRRPLRRRTRRLIAFRACARRGRAHRCASRASPRLRPYKGHRVLVDAVARLARRARPSSSISSATGPLRGELERQCARLGVATRVHFLGGLTEPAVAERPRPGGRLRAGQRGAAGR